MKNPIIVSAIVLALIAQFAFGKILDPESSANAILDSLANEIHSKGIDVRRQWGARSPTPEKRPVLAPLQGFASSFEAEAARVRWMKDFEGKIHSVLLGVKPVNQGESTSTQLSLTKFKQAWERAPQSQRVFLSFSRADAAYALDVKKALENRGFATFIYLESANKAPSLTPREAGHFFATAGHRFVIDSQNARRSPGVWFEKALLGRYIGLPPPTSVVSCTCNTYRNGYLVSSRQIPQGAVCGEQMCR